MKKLKLYILALVPLLLGGCSQEGLQEQAAAPPEPAAAIGFGASIEVVGRDEAMPEASRRAVNAMETAGQLADGGGFGVFASYTGLHRFSDSNVSSDFMYNTHVTYDNTNGVWIYEPVKYWPNGEGEVTDGVTEAKHYVSFFAYAPYSDRNPATAAGYCIPTFHLQHEVTNPWLTYRLHTDVAQQVDLLYAVPLIDRTRRLPATREMFTFRHALACVGDRITIGVAESLKDIYRGRVTGVTTQIAIRLKSITVNYRLTERARLVLWTGGEANWQTIVSGDALTPRSVTITPATPHVLFSYDGSADGGSTYQTDGHGVYYIPLHIGSQYQTAEVTMEYDVVTTRGGGTTTEDKSTAVTLTLSDYAEAYQPARHLYLNMTLKNE